MHSLLGSDRLAAPSEPHVHKSRDLHPMLISSAKRARYYGRRRKKRNDVASSQHTYARRATSDWATRHSWALLYPLLCDIVSFAFPLACLLWHLLGSESNHRQCWQPPPPKYTNLSPTFGIKYDVRFSRQLLQSLAARFLDLDTDSGCRHSLPEILDAAQCCLRDATLHHKRKVTVVRIFASFYSNVFGTGGSH